MADELARQRRELPRVAIEKEYRVDADAGRGPRHPAGVARPCWHATMCRAGADVPRRRGDNA